MIKDTMPASDFVVVSTDPIPGQSVSYQVVPKGVQVGYGDVTTSMRASRIAGVTIRQDGIRVFAP